jgi:hypothetical protein
LLLAEEYIVEAYVEAEASVAEEYKWIEQAENIIL